MRMERSMAVFGETASQISPVILERRDHVAMITLNRPKALNAVNATLSAAVGEALEEINSDPELRVGIITGSGRAFCAGADLKELAAGNSVYAAGHPEWGFGGIVQHYIEKPLIAAVNGPALGGGTEIVLACDLAVMNSEATLGLPEVSRGLVAAAGGLLRLPRQIPHKIALEAALTGEPISATKAAAWGLVNRVAAPDQVLEAAMKLADRIAANAPLAVQTSKRIIQRAALKASDWEDELWEINEAETRVVRASADAIEGPQAFAAKRPPQWTGK